MRGQFSIVLLGLLLLAAATASLVLSSVDPQSAGAVPLSFSAEADAYVNESSPTTNYGSATTLRVDGSPLLRSYLRFNVQGMGSITSATLRIFANSSQTIGFDVHDLSEDTWSESEITYASAPPFSPGVVTSSGPVSAGVWYELNVTPLVAGNGPVSLVLATTHATALSLASSESSNGPQLVVDGTTPPPTDPATPTQTPTPTPAPTSMPSPTPQGPTPSPIAGRLTVISRSGNTYLADAQWGGPDYSGTSLKIVGEGALYDLDNAGGGTILFQSGIFDFGPDFFYIRNVANLEFAGQGMDETIIQNNTDAFADTEPFNVGFGDSLVVRDMTVSAGGSLRTTSDALDFDSTNNSLVDRVKVTASRARGIIFDGKGAGGEEANSNTIRNCIVTGTQSHGIELLAADNNRIENCTISGTGGHGIQITKSSSVATTPNEKSNDNVISGNTIQNVLTDGINLISSDRNDISYNTISGSGRDGIRLDSANSITCDDNVVFGNTSINNLKWGLNINSSLCNGTIVGANSYSGNIVGPIQDNGTNTQTATPTPITSPTLTPTPTPVPTPSPTPTPAPVTTGLFSCSSAAAVTSNSGDNNGFEVTPLEACADAGGTAQDINSGTGSPQSCTASSKDRSVFSGYGVSVPPGATVLGIEIRLDARADSGNNSPRMCVELSWNGGASWTAPLTAAIGPTETTTILGGQTNLWGHTWSTSELGDGSFRVRVSNRSQDVGRDFFLDWVAARVTYRP